MSDEEIESKVHDAVVEETETRHNSKSKARFRVRITINVMRKVTHDICRLLKNFISCHFILKIKSFFLMELI